MLESLQVALVITQKSISKILNLKLIISQEIMQVVSQEVWEMLLRLQQRKIAGRQLL